MKKSFVCVALVFAIALILSACSSTPKNEGDSSKSLLSNAPAWVKNSGKSDGKNICAAVGMDTSEETITDDLDFATNRARTELARQTGVVINASFKDEREKAKTNGQRGGQEAIIDAAIQDVNNKLVAFSTRQDAWDNGKQLYVLVCIETEKFLDLVKSMQNMDEETYTHVFERATKQWDELRKRADEKK